MTCSCDLATCLSCVRTRVVGERAAQGLPPRITDSAALSRVATLLDDAGLAESEAAS